MYVAIFLFHRGKCNRMYLVPDYGRKYCHLCIVRLQSTDRLMMKYEKNDQGSDVIKSIMKSL